MLYYTIVNANPSLDYGDHELSQDYGDNEIRSAQNKTSSDRVEEYAFPLTCSLELDSPVEAEYQAIDTYNIAFTFKCTWNHLFIPPYVGTVTL